MIVCDSMDQQKTALSNQRDEAINANTALTMQLNNSLQKQEALENEKEAAAPKAILAQERIDQNIFAIGRLKFHIGTLTMTRSH